MSQSPLVDLIARRAWPLRAENGEYLDLAPDADGEARLCTVPISRLRHAFRIAEVRDLGRRRWSVTVEPIPLGPGAAIPGAVPHAGGEPLQVPMQLAHRGCLHFELTAPGAPAEQGRTAPLAGVPLNPRGLAVDVDFAALATTDSGIPFPAFEGDAARAYAYLVARLPFDIRSERLDEAALARQKRPRDIRAAAWSEVMDQLRLEIHYRMLCRQHFDGAHRFVQDVFIENAGLVETVGGLIGLEADEVVHIAIAGMYGAIAKGVSAAPVPGAEVVGAALGVAFTILLRDRGPGEATIAVALAEARDAIATAFEDVVTAIGKSRQEVAGDWGRLEQLGRALEADGSDRWPDEDALHGLRTEARRTMEICLWKDLLKLAWHHMTPENDPGFLREYSDSQKAAYERAHPNYWIEWRPGTQTDPLGKKTRGFFVWDHWLGRGSQAEWHHEPSRAMCERLFDHLQVAREEVFTDLSWGLTRERFHTPGAGGIGPFPGGM